jgi:hypothetical protein
MLMVFLVPGFKMVNGGIMISRISAGGDFMSEGGGALEESLERLRIENERLKNERKLAKSKVMCIEKITEVPPPDYEQNKKRLQQLETRYRKLKSLINYGNVSNLETLIDQYTTYSRNQLKKIVTELQLNEYEDSDFNQVKEFISFLDAVRTELEAMTSLQQKTDPSESTLSKCQLIIQEIAMDLQKNFNSIQEDRALEILFTLKTLHQIVLSCIHGETKGDVQ